MKKIVLFSLLSLFVFTVNAQSWQTVGGGASNSSHGLLTFDNKLTNLGSFNNVPCDRVAAWDGASWSCLANGVGIVARAGVIWNGKMVVVGDFWNNFQPCVGCNGIAVWDGIAWTPLDQGFNNDVLTVTVFNGELIVGGDFSQANGVPVGRVVRWDTTNSKFETMGLSTTLFDNDVRCMTEFNGELYVGGDFNNVDGNSPSDGLVKWDPNNNVWLGGNLGVDLIGGVNETVRVLYVNPNDGNLYMGGHFPELHDGDSLAQDFDMSGVAMYDGSNWFPLGTGLNDYCRAMHEYNGNLIVGGFFTTADGVTCNKIAKWVPSLGTFQPMGQGFDGVGQDEYVKSAEVWNGIFFAGGAYTQAEGVPRNYIAQWFEPPTAAPTASMTPSTTSGCETTCINFTDNSTSNPTNWTWTFPGSSTPTSSTQHPLNICYPSAGSYTAKLVACNGNGCDSTTVNITISGVSIANPTAINACDSLSYNSTMYYTTTLVNDTSFGGSANGCDSITNQQININTAVVTNQSAVVSCDSAQINGVWYFNSQTVSDYYPGGAFNTCDSTDVTVLTINSSVVTNQPALAACDSAQINGVWYFNSQTVSDYYPGGAFNTCDSTDVTILTINSSIVTNQPPVAACDSAQVNGIWYFNSQTISDYYPGGAFNTCDSTDVTVLTINTVNAATTTNNDTITAVATGASYQWLDCDNNFAIIPGETNLVFVAPGNGNYAVQVTQNGCTDTSACVLILATGVSNGFNKVTSIYPNPTNGLVNVHVKDNDVINYTLFSLDGRIITQKQAMNSNSFVIDLNNESKGIYLLKIEFLDVTKVYKIIKQ